MKTFFAFSVLLAVQLITFGADDYQNGPDSKTQEGVLKGEVLKFTFDTSRLYPGTTRDYWIYVPKQYDPAKPACLHVNQDGIQFNAPIVFDNLIAKKEMPVTIGIFITPGRVKSGSETALDRFNRCVEYDAIDERYAEFLIGELLPDAEKKTTSDGRPIRFSHDGNDRAIAGSSSGAIAGFVAAWHKPDSFQRVFSSIGTFVDHRGGNVFPALIRKTEAKPLRVFLQDGSNDGNGHGGNWFLSNQEMLSALEFAGYEVNHAWGDGGHNGKHATSIFPDAVRWLWKDWPKRVEKGVNSKQPAARIFADSEWNLVSSSQGIVEGAATDKSGNVYFSVPERNAIQRITPDGKIEDFIENADGAAGLAFGPDERLYACQTRKKRVVAYTPDGKRKTIANDIAATDIIVSHNGDAYVTDTAKQLWLLRPGEAPKVLDKNTKYGIEATEPLNQPKGLALTPDQSLLIVSDQRGLYGWSYCITPNGTLYAKQPFHYLHVPDGATDTDANSMTFDTDGRIYIGTRMGIQFCDQAGRLNGILSKPRTGEPLTLAFGGAQMDQMYAFNDGHIYVRKTKVKGVRVSDPPFKTKPPPL